MPRWLRRPLPRLGKKPSVEKQIRDLGLHTVCEEAKCPNRAECFGRGTSTFLICGETCSRHCTFCSVGHGSPSPLDPHEPENVARAAVEMGLRFVVLTSVTRDDLPDGAAAHFAQTISAIKAALPKAGVEALIPDFGGNTEALERVLASEPHVLNHNIETVPRLYPQIRPQAIYRRSLDVLSAAARRIDWVKSGMMVGLGETPDEVRQVLRDLREAGCNVLTIGQYLRPTPRQVSVREYVEPSRFAEYREFAHMLGFRKVFSGPYVRSSYRAEEIRESEE